MSITTVSLELSQNSVLSMNYPIDKWYQADVHETGTQRQAVWAAITTPWAQRTLAQKLAYAGAQGGDGVVKLVNGVNSATPAVSGDAITDALFYDPVARLWFKFSATGVVPAGISPYAADMLDSNKIAVLDWAGQQAAIEALRMFGPSWTMKLLPKALFDKLVATGELDDAIVKVEYKETVRENMRTVVAASAVAGIAGYALGAGSGRGAAPLQ